MMLSKKIENLKKALEPYMFCWEEWISNGNCNLRVDEIEIINHYIKSDFQSEISDLVKTHTEVALIDSILKKLEIGQPVFILVVVTEFLHSLLKLAKKSSIGYDKFLNCPIGDLDLPTNLKVPLSNFKVHSISMLFTFYKAQEFRAGPLYNYISDFMIAKKIEKIVLT